MPEPNHPEKVVPHTLNVFHNQNHLPVNVGKQEDHPDIDGMIEAINRQNIHEIAGKFGNVLELVTAGKYPVIGEIEQVMKEEGAVNAMMSGSGPTVFGIFDNRDKMAAAARSLRKSGLAKTVFATDIYNRDGGFTDDK